MSFVYLMAYPIEDDTLTTSQVINQATLIYPEDAEERGIRITGPVKVWIDEDKVRCEAPAEPIEGRKIRVADQYGWQVAALNGAGRNDRQVADELGLQIATVQRIRTELGLRPVRKHAA